MLRRFIAVYISSSYHIMEQSNKGIATAVGDIMTPELITETVAAAFEARGSPMMTRAARLCVQACATYANLTMIAMLPLGTVASYRAPRSEEERYTATQAVARATAAGNVKVHLPRTPFFKVSHKHSPAP